jgi:SWI/SNF-related matrix-associated actin-dependent regulator of chromatin subfamily A-like protein 1
VSGASVSCTCLSNFPFTDHKTRTWSFNLSDYDQLTANLQDFKANGGQVNVEGIPDWVKSAFRKPIPTVHESCLEVIEEELLKSLLKFQVEGVCFGVARNGRFLLADDMGLGKTRQALAIADFYKEDWPLLIITTATTRTWWQKQIQDLLPKVNVMDVVVMESGKDSIMSAKVLICSYTSLNLNMTRLVLKEFGTVILDESQNVKSHKAQQTTNATKLCEKAKHVIMISGTPATSRPAELYPQLKILDPKFSTWYNFTKRYCNGHDGAFGWVCTGATNLDELNCFLRRKFMIRRTKAEVYSELGGKNRKVVELKISNMKKKEKENMQGLSEQYHKAEGKKQQQQEILLHWYNQTAGLKTEAVRRYLEEFLKNSTEKCLIFVHHLSLMSAISNCLADLKIRFMCIEGSTKSETRDSNVEQFQNDPALRCAVLSIKACSAGITLTAASTVIFAELDWTPANLIQAEARAHRIGQEREVTCIYLIAPGTADEVLWRMLQEKQKNLTKAGIGATGEHLGENLTTTSFDASSPSLATPGTPKITNFFTPKTSPDSEVFYSAENIQENSDDILNGILADRTEGKHEGNCAGR